MYIIPGGGVRCRTSGKSQARAQLGEALHCLSTHQTKMAAAEQRTLGPPRGCRGTLGNWATWFGEGLRRGTHLHSRTSLSPNTVQQVGLTKDLNYHHKHEPKAHSHPPPPPHACARAHAHAHRLSHPRARAPTHARARTHTHAHTHTHTQVNDCNVFVHDRTGRCRAGLAFHLQNTNTFLKIMKIQKTKK